MDKMLESKKESVKTYFDNISDEYRNAYDINTNSLRSYIFLTRKEKVLNLLGHFNGRILDVGCGPAVFTEELLGNGNEFWGIDISKVMVENAKKIMSQKDKVGKSHFVVGDIENLDFSEGYFDCVLCIGVLEYLNDDSLALKEIYRVLKSKGTAIFTVPNLASPFSLFEKLTVVFTKVFLKALNIFKLKIKTLQESLLLQEDIIDKYYFPWRFNKELLSAGFKIDKNIFHIYRLAFLNKISPSLALAFSKKLEVLSRSPFYWMGINYIVKAHKE